jgi:hypothetical protein
MRVRNSKGVISIYRSDIFSNYLVKLGVSKLKADRVAIAIPGIELQKNRTEITTLGLKTFAREVEETGRIITETYDIDFNGNTNIHSELESVPTNDELLGESLVAQPKSVFEIPLLGFSAEAKIVADVNPELAEFTEALILYARTAAEESFRENNALLREPLQKMGLTEKAIDSIEDRLMADHFPLPSESLIENLVELQEKLIAKGDMIFENPAGSFSCSLLIDAYTAYNEAPKTTTKRYWPEDAEIKEVPRQFIPEDWIYIGEPPNEYGAVAVASLERPFQASGSNFAAQCIKPVSSTNDDLRAKDGTYLNTVIDVYSGDNLRHYSSPSPVIPPQYHQPPRDEIMPPGWTENIEPGLNIFVYSFSLTEKNQFPYADKLNKLIKDNDEKIKDKIGELAEKAGDSAEGALSASPAAPLAKIGGKLVESIAKQGLKIVYDLVKDAFGDGSFPTSRIIHTVNYNPPALPHSTFVVVVGEKLQNNLYAITRDLNRPNIKASLNVDTRGNPKYPIGNNKNRRHQTFSRTMLGYSQTPPGVVPLDLWKKVGNKKAIAEWASAANRQGFRIVASIPQTNGGGNYVWALRADVFAVNSEGEKVSLM